MSKKIQNNIISILASHYLYYEADSELVKQLTQLVSINQSFAKLATKGSPKISASDLKKGVVCPHCGQYAKMYLRQMHKNMVAALVELYCQDKIEPEKKYFHISDDLGLSLREVGDFAKLKLWGFISPAINDNSKTKTSGKWQITKQGQDFVEGKIKVSMKAKVYNGECHGFEGEMVAIHHALGEDFDYKKLMNH